MFLGSWALWRGRQGVSGLLLVSSAPGKQGCTIVHPFVNGQNRTKVRPESLQLLVFLLEATLQGSTLSSAPWGSDLTQKRGKSVSANVAFCCLCRADKKSLCRNAGHDGWVGLMLCPDSQRLHGAGFALTATTYHYPWKWELVTSVFDITVHVILV